MKATVSNNAENAIAKSVNKSSLMKAAWALVKKSEGLTLSAAMKMAWRALKLRLEMTKHAVKFQYRKANGEVRTALGILTKNLAYTFKGTARAKCYTCIAYWDIEKKGFRSFTIDSLI